MAQYIEFTPEQKERAATVDLEEFLLRPGELVHGGKFPPLGEAAAHGAHHRSLPVQLLQHPPVPQMEGVIFADHAENGHAITPFQKITNSYKLVTNQRHFSRHYVQVIGY